MNSNTKIWLHGLGAALIGGGATSVVSAFGASMIDSAKFNLQSAHGVASTFGLMGITFLCGGILNTMFYLKQSPLPVVQVSVTKTETTQTDVTVSKQ